MHDRDDLVCCAGCASSARRESNYSVVELGELGGTAGSANGINDRGWVLRAGLWGQFLFSDAGERGSHDQLQTHVGRCSQ